MVKFKFHHVYGKHVIDNYLSQVADPGKCVSGCSSPRNDCNEFDKSLIC